MKMSAYIALLRKDKESDYGVEFPDFPGCVTAGSTLEEARANAEEALALHIDGMAEDGEAIPEPSSLDRIAALPESKDVVAFLVPVRKAPEKILRVNITVPASELGRIDAYAESKGLTRSSFLVEAAGLAMGRKAAAETVRLSRSTARLARKPRKAKKTKRESARAW